MSRNAVRGTQGITRRTRLFRIANVLTQNSRQFPRTPLQIPLLIILVVDKRKPEASFVAFCPFKITVDSMLACVCEGLVPTTNGEMTQKRSQLTPSDSTPCKPAH